MSTNNDGGPAFPMTGEGCHNPLYSQPGMTMRDYFAGQAMPLVDQDISFGRKIPSGEFAGMTEEGLAAMLCYQYADAMLRSREAKK